MWIINELIDGFARLTPSDGITLSVAMGLLTTLLTWGINKLESLAKACA